MNTIHPAFKLLDDSETPRVHNIITKGLPAFPTQHDLYGVQSGVVQRILFQRKDRVMEFSGTIALTLESWSPHENTDTARVENVCLWRMQVLPENREVRNAIDMSPQNKPAIIDEIKRALNMLKEVPLIRGSAFILRFGHRGKEYPFIEVFPMFYFGQYVIIDEVNAQIEEYNKKRRNPFFVLTGLLYWSFYQFCQLIPWVNPEPPPKVPEPVESPPDLWQDHQHITIVKTRFETMLGSLVRRIELRFAQDMIESGIEPAPGDSNTVAFMDKAAEVKISRRRLERYGGVTVFRPENSPLCDDLAAQMLMHAPIGSGNPPPAPAGLGKAANSAAPPPPPPSLRTTVTPAAKRPPAEPVIPTVVEQGDRFVVTNQRGPRTAHLKPTRRPTSGVRIDADAQKSVYIEDDE